MTITESAVIRGGELDFAEYVATRRPHLLRIAYVITQDRDAAEDLLQGALARGYAHWSRIPNERTADAYLRRAMVNVHASRPGQDRHRQAYLTAEPPESPMPWPAMTEPPWDRVRMWSQVTALPPGQRAAVVLCYFEDLPEPAAAAVLGCSVGTVKSNASRGLENLQRLAGDTPRCDGGLPHRA